MDRTSAILTSEVRRETWEDGTLRDQRPEKEPQSLGIDGEESGRKVRGAYG